jgi:hypothetical protein
MTTRTEMEVLYDMITRIPIHRLGIKHPGVIAGAPADLVILGKPNMIEALRFHQPPQRVIS